MDTLEVKKVTENKHDLSYFSNRGDDLYIVTTAYKSQNQKENGTSYFKVTDKGLVETYSIYNISAISDEMAVKEGTFLAICATDKDVVAEGNQLLYVKDGETTMIDQDYYYDLIGLWMAICYITKMTISMEPSMKIERLSICMKGRKVRKPLT